MASNGYLVDHSALSAASTAIDEASITLNQTVSSLMSQIEAMMPTWQGLGATAFQGYMARYHQDATQMNQALTALGQAVAKANTGYAGQDQAAQGAWK